MARASRAAGAKAVEPFGPKLTSTIGLIMNSQPKSHTEDWSQFQAERALREAWRLVAQLDIEAVEEFALLGVRRHEEMAELEAAGQERAAGIDREGRVDADLVPVGDTAGEFRRAIQRVVRGEATLEVGCRAAAPYVVEMLLKGKSARRRDLGVVDLDLVDRMRGRRRVLSCNRSQ